MSVIISLGNLIVNYDNISWVGDIWNDYVAIDDTKLVVYSNYCFVGSIIPGKVDNIILFIVLSTI